MIKFSRNDIVLTFSPFVITLILLVIGYQVLIRQTPQARISIPTQSQQHDILTQDITEHVFPTTAMPEEINASLATIPKNRAELATIISQAIESNVNAIYYSLPVTLNPDGTVVLTNVDASSEENISRWTKKALNTTHENGLHTILTLTINASDTVKDPTTFTANYTEFTVKWAKLATEYGASFFNPGITIGHPVYSNLTPVQMNFLLNSVQSRLRKHFTGNLGVNLCCSDTLSASPAGFTYITIISTREHSVQDLQPIAEQAALTHKMTHVFAYDRSAQRLVQTQRLYPTK